MTSSATWKDKVRDILPWPLYWRLKRIREELLAMPVQGNLTDLAKIYKTDKWGHHHYTPIYETRFRALRHQPVRLLEIGIGGYTRPHYGGDSLRMWKKYFYKGTIIGLDLYNKSAIREKRIRTYQGDQADPALLEKLSSLEGPFDIIIDDGSHVQSHIIASFESLFPLMPSGGIYVIEDTQTAYWPKFEGSTQQMKDVPSAMNYFIDRVHAVNRSEWLAEEESPFIPDDGIASISFYHNLLVIVRQ